MIDTQLLEEALQWHDAQSQQIYARLLDSQLPGEEAKCFHFMQFSAYTSQFYLYACVKNSALPVHSQDYYELVIPYDAFCVLCVDEKEVILHPGDFYLVCPGVQHSIQSEGRVFCLAGQQGALFSIYLPMLEGDEQMIVQMLRQIRTEKRREVMLLRKPLGDCAFNLVRTLLLESYCQEYLYEKVMENILSIILVMLARQLYRVRPPLEKNIRSKLADIMAYLKENSDTVTLEETARRFNYNADYLSATLRRETGKSFLELMRDYKLERAAVLLKTTEMTAANIASLVGYSQYSGFFKAFKQKYGVSPHDFVRGEASI